VVRLAVAGHRLRAGALLLFLRAGNLDLPGYRLAFVALMSRLRPVPALVTVDDAAWRGWRRAS
jgi:hypothetical protein